MEDIPSAGALEHELFELLVRRLEVVVDDDDVVDAGGLGELELVLGLGEALLDAGLGLGAAAAEALLEGLLRGWRDEDVAGVDARGLDLLDTLYDVSIILSSDALPWTPKGQQTSISMSKSTTLPFAVCSSMVFLLVPYLLPPNLACSTKPFCPIRSSKSAIGTKW